MPRTFLQELLDLRSRHLFRNLREIESAQEVEIVHERRTLLNFSSNDYLGLANSPALKQAAKDAIDRFGTGSGASRLVCGSLTPHMELERKIAAFKGTEAALVFSTGYSTAVGTISAMCKTGDVVILDKLCHASLIDGARLSNATIRVFPHNHLGKLEAHLQWAQQEMPDARVLVVTESVFSMDGDRAPLREIVELKDRFKALLLVDEAHAAGLIGKQGRGLADELGVANRVDLQMGTLGKAFGSAGGYIAAERHAIDLLINRARSFIYSTAQPPAVSAASSAALDLVCGDEGEQLRGRLRENLIALHRGISESFPQLEKPQSAILPLMLGAEDLALAAARWLRMEGFLIPAIRFPTVARGSARLRITVSAAHTPQHIEKLVEALRGLAKKIETLEERVEEVV